MGLYGKNSALQQKRINLPKRFWAIFFGITALVVFLLFIAAGSKNSNLIILISGILFLAAVFAAYRYIQKTNYVMLSRGNVIAILLVAGILLRFFLAISIYGYKSDIACWIGWSHSAYTLGLDHFYTNGPEPN